jgi:hypothetical protein
VGFCDDGQPAQTTNQKILTMKVIALCLDYDARQKLHSLPFEKIAPATTDVCLRLLPQAEGVFESRGMAAVRKTH